MIRSNEMPIWFRGLIRHRSGNSHGNLPAASLLHKHCLFCSHYDISGHYVVNRPDMHGLLDEYLVILGCYDHARIGTYIAFLFPGSDMDETKVHIKRFNQGLRNRDWVGAGRMSRMLNKFVRINGH